MSIIHTIMDIKENYKNLMTIKNKTMEGFDNIEKKMKIKKSDLVIILLLSMLYCLPFIWFGIVYINNIHPTLNIEYKNLFLILIYLMIINYSFVVLNDFIVLFLLCLSTNETMINKKQS